MIKTGFKFIDEDVGGIHNDSVVLIGGSAQVNELIISLLQGILQNNDGYILLTDTLNCFCFTRTIFDKSQNDDDYTLLSKRFIKDRVLKRNKMNDLTRINWKRNIQAWLEGNKYSHLKNKKLLALCCFEPKASISKIKEISQVLQAPFICIPTDNNGCYMQIPPTEISNNDICIWLDAVNGYQEPIKITTITQHKKLLTDVNTYSTLKYSKHLKDCENLWFYEVDNE